MHHLAYFVLPFLLVACSAPTDPTPANTKPPEGAAELRALFVDLRAAIHGGDVDKAAQITNDLLPDEASLRRVLKDDAGDALDKILALHARLTPATPAQAATVFKTEEARTEVVVHRATTEEIIAYEKGTAAYQEFPGGARRVAPDVLRAKTAFYEVELLEPGKSSGMKYHLFYFDDGWRMLGPIWRALR